MPPSLTRPHDDAVLRSFGGGAPAADDRLPMASAAAVILGLSVVAWAVVIQGLRMVAMLAG